MRKETPRLQWFHLLPQRFRVRCAWLDKASMQHTAPVIEHPAGASGFAESTTTCRDHALLLLRHTQARQHTFISTSVQKLLFRASALQIRRGLSEYPAQAPAAVLLRPAVPPL